MGNSWSYEFRVREENFANAVTSALDLLGAHGFEFGDENWLCRVDGEVIVARSEIRSLLIEGGGSVSAMDVDDDDVALTASPHGCELQYSVLHDLRADRASDVRAERKLDALFRDAIESITPWFARVHDEWLFEKAWLDNSFEEHIAAYERSLAARESPSLLTWKTFVDRTGRRVLDPSLFTEIPRGLVTRESIAGGMLLTLGGDRPWTARVAKLEGDPARYQLVG